MAQEKIVIFHHDERGAVRTWSEVDELVRCRDCKFFNLAMNGWNGSCDLHIDAFKGFYANDFCSYGEKKEHVQIVRCRDCEHFSMNPCTTEYGRCKKVLPCEIVMYCDDFCSYGEKKE